MAVFGVGGGNPYYINFGATSATSLTMPSGVVAVSEASRPRPAFARWNGDLFTAGYFSRPMIFTANNEFFPSGITAPAQMPTFALGASSGGSTGEAIGYLTFRQERPNGQIVHESNPIQIGSFDPYTGEFTPTTLSATGQGFAWGNLPTVSVDPRVTHIVGYRSMDGDLPKEAWKRPLNAGVTSLTENTLTGNRGVPLPSSTNPDGQEDVDLDARGVVPYCKIAVSFHDAMFYMGFPDKPWLIAPSRQFEPESVDLTEDSPTALVTLGRESVVGAYYHEATERLLVFCSPPKIYAITGYGPDDYDITPVNSFYELLSHAAIRPVGPDGDVWFPTQEGVIYFNGSFVAVTKDRQREWRNLVTQYPQECANAFAVYSDDADASGYKINLNIPDPVEPNNDSYYWFFHDDPTREGRQPDITNDVRQREDTCAAEVRPYGQPFVQIWTGDADGLIRLEDVAGDADDDGDEYEKTMDLISAHQWMPNQAGNKNEAGKLIKCDLYGKNETNEGTIEFYAGDDSAATAISPSSSDTIPAGALPANERQKVALTKRQFSGGQLAAGYGVAVRTIYGAPLGVEYRGMSLSYEDGGEQDRLPTEE